METGTDLRWPIRDARTTKLLEIMTSPQPSLSGPSSASAESTRKIDLNLTQVAAAALAAITAAVLGSTIGVAGTVIGAALASIVTTVSSTMYRYSLERSRERVAQRLLTARTSPLPTRSGPVQSSTGQSSPVQSSTDDPDVTQTMAIPAPAPARPHRILRWTAMAVGSVAAFVLAMSVITGFESATGQALSGGGTPTVPSVFGGEQPQPEPKAPAPVTTEPAEDGAPTSAPAASTSVPDDAAPTTAERTTRAPEPSADDDRSVLPVPTGQQRPQ